MTALSPAPDLSPEEAERVALFDAAEEPEEVTVERVRLAEQRARDERYDGYLSSDTAAELEAATAALTALRGDRGE